VTAWRMVIPAFSISFLVSPSVTQIFSAGRGVYMSVFAPEGPAGRLLTRVMRTFWARHYIPTLALCASQHR
jgi:hypothetical protein